MSTRRTSLQSTPGPPSPPEGASGTESSPDTMPEPAEDGIADEDDAAARDQISPFGEHDGSSGQAEDDAAHENEETTNDQTSPSSDNDASEPEEEESAAEEDDGAVDDQSSFSSNDENGDDAADDDDDNNDAPPEVLAAIDDLLERGLLEEAAEVIRNQFETGFMRVDPADRCAICLMTWAEQPEDIFRVPCDPDDMLRGHLFHYHCVAPWLMWHGTCPTCRRQL